jgi:hypothetical protein
MHMTLQQVLSHDLALALAIKATIVAIAIPLVIVWRRK